MQKIRAQHSGPNLQKQADFHTWTKSGRLIKDVIGWSTGTGSGDSYCIVIGDWMQFFLNDFEVFNCGTVCDSLVHRYR